MFAFHGRGMFRARMGWRVVMLKKLLVLGAIIAIIPMDRDKQAELFELARTAIADMGGFCSRNPDACEKGSKVAGEVAGELAVKAEAGAKMMVELARDQALGNISADRLPRFGMTGDDKPANPAPRLAAAQRQNNPFYGYQPEPTGTLERLPVMEDSTATPESGGTLNSTDLAPTWGLN
jgi:hypothetical protein